MGTPDLFDAAIVKQEIENSFPNEDDQVLGITYCDVSPKKEDNALMFPPSISTKLEPDFHFLQLDLTNCKCEGALATAQREGDWHTRLYDSWSSSHPFSDDFNGY
ncbi:uncharacterized protein LOC136027405 isoform X2 [Artemia franciscana]|uniref:uncharacterized protein LOC136027405 isoform X2 n=1 Tax=Artemia franciscana TaxID=6661 RepID=UPI0032D9BE22